MARKKDKPVKIGVLVGSMPHYTTRYFADLNRLALCQILTEHPTDPEIRFKENRLYFKVLENRHPDPDFHLTDDNWERVYYNFRKVEDQVVEGENLEKLSELIETKKAEL